MGIVKRNGTGDCRWRAVAFCEWSSPPAGAMKRSQPKLRLRVMNESLDMVRQGLGFVVQIITREHGGVPGWVCCVRTEACPDRSHQTSTVPWERFIVEERTKGGRERGRGQVGSDFYLECDLTTGR